MGRRKRKRPQGRQRRPGNRQPKKVIYIFCEGEETEPQYFRALKNKLSIAPRLARVQVVEGKRQGDPRRLRLAAQKILEQERDIVIDQSWLIYDCEPQDRQRYNLGREEFQKANPFNKAVSFPAFEIWLLLHYEMPKDAKAGTPRKAKDLLKTYLPDFDKNHVPFDKIDAKREIAKTRARKLWADAMGNTIYPASIATVVFRLVEELEALGTT
ncbi:MAG: RloB family protein [Acidobacteriota bacterium]|nr:RloB family protein [Acidobacteriota bacterium]